MTVAVVRYRCTGCDYEQQLRRRPHRRTFADGITTPAAAIIAWCHDQARVVESEELAPVEVLEVLLAHAEQDLGGEEGPREENGLSPDQLRRELEWRRGRVAPPHCLECGSTRISQESSPDPGGLSRLEHPGCGGELVIRGVQYEPDDDPGTIMDAEGTRISASDPLSPASSRDVPRS